MSSLSNRALYELVAQFPALWDPGDIYFRDRKVKDSSFRQLLDKCNRMSAVPITQEWLKKKLKLLNNRRCRYGLSKGNSGTTPGTPENQATYQRFLAVIAGHMEEISVNTPGTSENQMATQTNYNSRPIQIAEERSKMKSQFLELAAEYPCLWDRQDPNYQDQALKAQCREKLLMKYNSISTLTISMEQMKYKLDKCRFQLHLRQQRGQAGASSLGSPGSQTASPKPMQAFNGKGSNSLEKLVAEYPSLLDPRDLNYEDRALQAQCQELLVKYNGLSSIPIDMEQLMKKLQVLRARLHKRRQRAAENSSDEESQDFWISDEGTSSGSQNNEGGVLSASNKPILQTFTVTTFHDSIEPVENFQSVAQINADQQTGILSIVFHCCGVCGEVKSDCLNGEDKPYIINNKTTFTMNETTLELDFDKDVNVCQNCDTKLKEMYDFVKLVKTAQDRINRANIVNEMTADDDENEDEKFIVDSLTVTDTEILKQTVNNKRKSEESPENNKKFRVTIDLNSRDNDRSTMDDIEAYQMFKKDGLLENSKESADDPKVTITDDTEDIHDVQKNIKETLNDVSKAGELQTKDDIEIKYQMFKMKDAVSLANSKASAVESVVLEESEDNVFERQEIETAHVDTVDETGNIVSDDKRNDTVNKYICNSVKTNETSVVNLIGNGEPVCVMPQSDLIQLVESIVSRMLNK